MSDLAVARNSAPAALQHHKAAEVLDAQLARRCPVPAPPPAARVLCRNGMGALPSWAQLEPSASQIVDTIRRYLTQIGCVPGRQRGQSRHRAACVRRPPGRGRTRGHTTTAQVTPRHIEDYKPWLAKRPGQNKTRLTTATLAHRFRHAADVLRPHLRVERAFLGVIAEVRLVPRI